MSHSMPAPPSHAGNGTIETAQPASEKSAAMPSIQTCNNDQPLQHDRAASSHKVVGFVSGLHADGQSTAGQDGADSCATPKDVHASQMPSASQMQLSADYSISSHQQERCIPPSPALAGQKPLSDAVAALSLLVEKPKRTTTSRPSHLAPLPEHAEQEAHPMQAGDAAQTNLPAAAAQPRSQAGTHNGEHQPCNLVTESHAAATPMTGASKGTPAQALQVTGPPPSKVASPVTAPQKPSPGQSELLFGRQARELGQPASNTAIKPTAALMPPDVTLKKTAVAAGNSHHAAGMIVPASTAQQGAMTSQHRQNIQSADLVDHRHSSHHDAGMARPAKIASQDHSKSGFADASSGQPVSGDGATRQKLIETDAHPASRDATSAHGPQAARTDAQSSADQQVTGAARPVNTLLASNKPGTTVKSLPPAGSAVTVRSTMMPSSGQAHAQGKGSLSSEQTPVQGASASQSMLKPWSRPPVKSILKPVSNKGPFKPVGKSVVSLDAVPSLKSSVPRLAIGPMSQTSALSVPSRFNAGQASLAAGSKRPLTGNIILPAGKRIPVAAQGAHLSSFGPANDSPIAQQRHQPTQPAIQPPARKAFMQTPVAARFDIRSSRPPPSQPMQSSAAADMNSLQPAAGDGATDHAEQPSEEVPPAIDQDSASNGPPITPLIDLPEARSIARDVADHNKMLEKVSASPAIHIGQDLHEIRPIEDQLDQQAFA